jgi:hypothetical protein
LPVRSIVAGGRHWKAACLFEKKFRAPVASGVRRRLKFNRRFVT